MVNEVWKKIKWYENYEVSNFGNVRNNNFHRQNFTKEVKKNLKPNGYLRVVLSKNSKTKSFYVHRLVAEAFIENKKNKKYICTKERGIIWKKKKNMCIFCVFAKIF